MLTYDALLNEVEKLRAENAKLQEENAKLKVDNIDTYRAFCRINHTNNKLHTISTKWNRVLKALAIEKYDAEAVTPEMVTTDLEANLLDQLKNVFKAIEGQGFKIKNLSQ